MRLTDDAMLVFARMMNEECQERSCLDCTFFIEQKRKCLFDSRPVVWDDLPDTVEGVADREWDALDE